MALVHYLYIGHFIPEEGFVRIQDHRLVAARPLNMEVVDTLLRKYLGEKASTETLAEEWGMSIFPDYIVCYAWSPRPALEFAADYAEQQGATIVNMGSFLLMTPEQLRQAAAFNPPSAAAVKTAATSGG
jgi:hypothetical protein